MRAMRAMWAMRGAHQGDRGNGTEAGEEGKGGKKGKEGGDGKLLWDGTDIEGSTRGPSGPKKIKISKNKKKTLVLDFNVFDLPKL